MATSLTQLLLQLDEYTESTPVTDAVEPPSEKPVMTTRYTDPEWSRFIAEVEKEVEVSTDPRPYPANGSPEFNKTIDHTLLKLEARGPQIDELCSEARVAGFATVCVRPHFVQKAASNLKGSNIKVASVIGFPEGTYDLYQKWRYVPDSYEIEADTPTHPQNN